MWHKSAHDVSLFLMPGEFFHSAGPNAPGASLALYDGSFANVYLKTRVNKAGKEERRCPGEN
jgi:hypothetical protein